MEWPIEAILDEDALFYRIHHASIDMEGKITPGAFRNQPHSDPKAGMSVNWEKYSSPEQAREGARKPPAEYAVVKLLAGKVRKISDLTVIHEPLSDNQSHSEVFGAKDPEVRVKLLGICERLLDFDPALKKPK